MENSRLISALRKVSLKNQERVKGSGVFPEIIPLTTERLKSRMVRLPSCVYYSEFRRDCEIGAVGSTSDHRRSVLLGYETMSGNQLPHVILPNQSIGTEDGLYAVFAPDHSIISVGIGSGGGVVVVNAGVIPDLILSSWVLSREKPRGETIASHS
jgi:hypothetical protein